MQKIKSFFIKAGQWCKNAAVKTGGWCKRTAISAWGWTKKTASITWKWALAHKAAAGVIAGAAVLAITTAIVVPITVSSAKRREAGQETQQGEGEQTPPGEGGSGDSHTHTYAEAWTTSATEHWHASTCGHDVKKDEDKHTFGEPVYDSENNEYKRTCSTCGYIDIQGHTHTFSSEWSTSVTKHWHVSSCGHDVKSDEADHTFGDYVYDEDKNEYKRTCSVCDYVDIKNHTHTFSDKWSSNETQHWYASTCGHNVKDQVANHTFSDWAEDPNDDEYDIRTCSVCGYEDKRDHEHTYKEDWSFNGEYHWHMANCSHTTEYDEKVEHDEPTTKIGVYKDEFGYDYEVYKDECECGMICYIVYDVYDDNTYYEYVFEETLPTGEKSGLVKFYPNSNALVWTQLTIPVIGTNRVVNTGSDLYVDRAYDVSINGKQCYAQINPNAFKFNLGTIDIEDNWYLAMALNVDPDWKFEIDETTYDKSRKVVDWVWKEPPYGSDSGVMSLIYEDDDHEDIEISSLISTSDWDHFHQDQGDYTDELEIYHFIEDASCLHEIGDLYLREMVKMYLAYDEDYYMYGFHHSGTTIANNNGARSSGPAFFEDGAMLVRMKVEYGKLHKGSTLYYYDAFDGDGNPTGNVKYCSMAEFLSVKSDGGIGTKLDKGNLYADNQEYWVALTGTGLSPSVENLFCSDTYNVLFSASSSAHLTYMYSHQSNLIF